MVIWTYGSASQWGFRICGEFEGGQAKDKIILWETSNLHDQNSIVHRYATALCELVFLYPSKELLLNDL